MYRKYYGSVGFLLVMRKFPTVELTFTRCSVKMRGIDHHMEGKCDVQFGDPRYSILNVCW